MSARLTLFAAAAALAAGGRADDPPAKTATAVTTVAALNGVLKRDTDGTAAKQFVGKEVTVTGKVIGVTGPTDGAQLLALAGLPAAAGEPTGCTVTFPAAHPARTAVQGLKAGAEVRVKGVVSGVKGAAFTLSNPVLQSPAVPGAAPEPKRPDPPPPAIGADDLKTTAVALTTRFRDDKTDKLWLGYVGKELEVTGTVEYSARGAAEFGGGRALRLAGCPSDRPDQGWVVAMKFEADSPDLPRLRNVCPGDQVTVRAKFVGSVGLRAGFAEPRLVAGGEAPPPVLTPTRYADAGAFVRLVVGDRASAAKFLGQPVALTGTVLTAHPRSSRTGLVLDAGRLRPADPAGATVDCVVVDDQLDAVWQLPPGQKVRVVGVLLDVGKSQVRLTRCRVALAEPNPMPTVSAAVLSAAWQADSTAAAARYGGRWLFLTGEVAALAPAAGVQGTVVALRVPAGPRVEFGLSAEEAGRLRVGEAVRVKARCLGATADRAALTLADGCVLPEARTPLPVER